MQQMVIKWIPLQIYFLFRPPACRRAWEDFVGEEQGARVQLEAAAGGHRRPSTGDWGEDGCFGDGRVGDGHDSHGLVNFTNPLAAFQVRQGTFLVMVMVIMVVNWRWSWWWRLMASKEHWGQWFLWSLFRKCYWSLNYCATVNVHFKQSNNLCTVLRRVRSSWSRCGKA